MNNYVPGYGQVSARLVIIGEAPSFDEIESGRPFTGPSGKELDRLLRDAGINRGECWLTNVCKYFVPPLPFEKKRSFAQRCDDEGINLDEQINDLRIELQQINPNCILVLGGTALWAMTGKTKIQDYRGSIMLGMGFKCVSTYHPAHLLHQAKGEIKGYWNRQVMIFDMKRALAQSKFKEIILPSRSLAVVQNSAQLADFINRNEKNEALSVDIEADTDGRCLPICIGLSFNKSEGITVPLWNINDISNIPDSDLTSIWLLLAH